MTTVTSKRFDRSFDRPTDRRVSVINLHLCRMLENELKDLNEKQAASRRSLSQQIFEAREELMKKRMEKLAYDKEKQESWRKNPFGDSFTTKPRIRPWTATSTVRPGNTSTINKTLKSWAGMTHITRRELANVHIRPFSAHEANDETAQIMREKLRRSPDVYLQQIARKPSYKKTSDMQQDPSKQTSRRHSAQPTLTPASAWDRRKIHYHVKFDANDEVIQSVPELRRQVTAPTLTTETGSPSRPSSSYSTSRRSSRKLSFMREYLTLTNNGKPKNGTISMISEDDSELSGRASSQSSITL